MKIPTYLIPPKELEEEEEIGLSEEQKKIIQKRTDAQRNAMKRLLNNLNCGMQFLMCEKNEDVICQESCINFKKCVG